MADQELIDSLLRELVKYENRGDEVNADGVRKELKRHGWKPAAPAKRAEKESPAKETR